MRLVSYVSEDGSLRAGVVRQGRHGEEILDIGKIDPSLPADITELLKHGITGSPAMRNVLDSTEPGIPLADATLGPAVPKPGKILLLAGNYQSHIAEAVGKGVNKAEITPRFFIKPNTSIIGPTDQIRIPVVSDTVDYEIEIAAVIGKRGREITADDALDYVAGYLVFNDISARHLKYVDHRTPRPMDDFFDWLVGKWCDSFSVIGPYMVTADEIGDPTSLEMALSVNGELRQHSSAGEMIFSVAESIEWISRFVTLEPGDLICMGTPGGVGETTATYLQPGDHVHATISHLGDLNNPVVSIP
jgi:2-keto-4-pentenoate hydratase/2-oxohepta-3-ene-1,7-dioic acid hydratase in catechol pathway